MKAKNGLDNSLWEFRGSLLAAMFAITMVAFSPHAKADVIIGVQSVSANAGSTGNSLEVFLTNTGTAPLTISTFSFEISVATSNINLADATIGTTDSYIFAGHSLFGPDIATATGQTLDASDLFDVPASGATVLGNSTVGLGEVSFDVAAGTSSGLYAVMFSGFPATSLSDDLANNISFSTQNGSITVIGVAAVPEPSSLMLLGSGALTLVGFFRKKLRSRVHQNTVHAR